jgi:hypothetical protein
MYIPGLAKEYERTCDDCGHTWCVPKWAARPHMQGIPKTGRAQAAAAAAAVVAANARLAEKVAVFRQCHECDSVHYKQRAIRS